MITVEIAIFLGLIGAAMGSFADAITWRIHTKRNFVSDRSECESCHHKLGPLDLIPIVSWLLLHGRCRYCRKRISAVPVIAEIIMATLFVLSYLYWPLGFGVWQAQLLFALWLAYLVIFAMLVVYDLRWMLLPDIFVFPLIGLGFVDAALRTSLMPDPSVTSFILYAGYGMCALAGVYGALYVASRGKWVGFGDVKLSIFMGAVLGWERALLVLVLANVIGCLVIIPGMASGKLKRTSRVPFGPFLIIGFVIAGLWGSALIAWYTSLIGL